MQSLRAREKQSPLLPDPRKWMVSARSTRSRELRLPDQLSGKGFVVLRDPAHDLRAKGINKADKIVLRHRFTKLTGFACNLFTQLEQPVSGHDHLIKRPIAPTIKACNSGRRASRAGHSTLQSSGTRQCWIKMNLPLVWHRPLEKMTEQSMQKKCQNAFYKAKRQPVRVGVLSLETKAMFWWPIAESNHGHADFQSAALPTELIGQNEAEL